MNEVGLDTTGNLIRSDKIRWAHETGPVAGCEELYEASDTLLAALGQQQGMHDALAFVDFAHWAMFSVYDDAARYVRHADTVGHDPRHVTAIFYLNKNWHAHHGGQIHLHGVEGGDNISADIEPRFNRLLLFWSHLEHEVLPSSASASQSLAGTCPQ
eukprot:TRINITY_DN1255_c0_g1_i1.p1 TRINITY_DN1255_c0_g1~~TRINITY_DN1255_c0_g1_i1.p1  ORF type:complete len:184 (+),score=23.70 TRINITY_DN1255_c0_g1_i1:83-553(+)